MQELRFVAVSEDGSYAVLAVPGRSARFTLPIDERLRAVALGQTGRLAQYEIEVESPLRPKEIQARIRAGETIEEIADAAGIAVERVRWFEGPVLAERAYVAQQAQSASVRRQGDSAPGPRLGEMVPGRLKGAGADPDDAQWDSRKRGDGSWLVQLTFPSGGRLHTAEWVFDPRRRHVMPADDNAARLSLPESELPPPASSVPGEATVTPLAPRLGAASVAGGQVGRLRQDRPAWAEPEPDTRHEAPSRHEAATREASTRREVPVQHEPRAPREPATREPAARHDAAARHEAPARHEGPASREVAARHEATASADSRDSSAAVRPETPEPALVAEPATEAQPIPEASPVAQTAQAIAQAAQATAQTPQAPAPATPDTQPARGRRKSARGRRSSVPSWDEIMLGSSREHD